MNNCKIINNSGMKIDDEIHSLVDFTKERFGFKRPPTIFLDNDDQNASKTLAKTGYYDPESMEIHVYTTGRHPKDVLRSIAHELVHHNQNENGDFENAGYSGKGYAQKNPHLRKMELQANDPMLFRDWEDSLKEKYPTIYNEGRTNIMSLKDWKNKELSKNLTKKWGFKMDLTKLNEAHCGGDHDKADESHCMEEDQSEDMFNAMAVAAGYEDHRTMKPISSKKKEPKKGDQSSHAKAKKRTLEEDELDENLEEKEMSKKEKEFAALAEPKDKITYADKIAGAKKEK